MIEVRVGARGELVIPKRIRERYGINGRIILFEGTNSLEIRAPSKKDSTEQIYSRWNVYRVNDVSKWDLSGEPYED